VDEEEVFTIIILILAICVAILITWLIPNILLYRLLVQHIVDIPMVVGTIALSICVATLWYIIISSFIRFIAEKIRYYRRWGIF